MTLKFELPESNDMEIKAEQPELVKRKTVSVVETVKPKGKKRRPKRRLSTFFDQYSSKLSKRPAQEHLISVYQACELGELEFFL